MCKNTAALWLNLKQYSFNFFVLFFVYYYTLAFQEVVVYVKKFCSVL